MTIDFLAGEPHFFDHLYPLWEALPLRTRGIFYVEKPAFLHASAHTAVEYTAYSKMRRVNPTGVIVVASYRDMITTQTVERPCILSEHGAGQSYSSYRHTSYAGGPGRFNVILHLVPGSHPAMRNKEAYPEIPVVEIGCPKMEPHWRSWDFYGPRPRGKPPIIGVSWHWDACPVGGVSEMRSAFSFYRKELAYLLSDKWSVVGHAHPQAVSYVKPYYEKLGIPWASYDFILRNADVLVMDNSSMLFEFASLDKPVVLLNCPYYRREVNHGLRFWDLSGIGPQCNTPRDFPKAVEEALEDSRTYQVQRKRIIPEVYTTREGTSLAVEAILGAAGEL